MAVHLERSQGAPLLFIIFVLCVAHTGVYCGTVSSGTTDGSEEWGYVDVRPGAHMFWWLYKTPHRNESAWPIVLWLQGGPGASGIGIGNFGEVGPLNEALLPRKETWLKRAHLLFVDSPVGVGFSYVDEVSLISVTDVSVAEDLVVLIKEFFHANPALEGNPLFIVGESYGGKHACLFGLALSNTIRSEGLKINLGGVALGDSWISPVDFVLSWGAILKTLARIDEKQESIIYSQAEAIQNSLNNGEFKNATTAWSHLEDTVSLFSSGVSFYNFLIDDKEDTSSTSASSTTVRKNSFSNIGNYLRISKRRNRSQPTPDLESTMNGPVRTKLKIIPASLTWTSFSNDAFDALNNDFMKDVIPQVDNLLAAGVKVAIYNGQVDLICATLGTEAWIQKLQWTGLKSYNNANRIPILRKLNNVTIGFLKSFENLSFYSILKAGHMAPADQPYASLKVIEMITSY